MIHYNNTTLCVIIACEIFAQWTDVCMMLNDYKSTAQNRAAPKVTIVLFNSLICMYDAPFTIWWNCHSYLSQGATYRPIMWSVGWWNGDVKGFITFSFLIIMQYYKSVLCSSSLQFFNKKYRKKYIVKYYYNLKERLSMLIYFKMSFISVMQNWIYFSASLLQSSVHDTSEIIIICWFIINVGNSCAAFC